MKVGVVQVLAQESGDWVALVIPDRLIEKSKPDLLELFESMVGLNSLLNYESVLEHLDAFPLVAWAVQNDLQEVQSDDEERVKLVTRGEVVGLLAVRGERALVSLPDYFDSSEESRRPERFLGYFSVTKCPLSTEELPWIMARIEEVRAMTADKVDTPEDPQAWDESATHRGPQAWQSWDDGPF
jgi:hypothetical protein